MRILLKCVFPLDPASETADLPELIDINSAQQLSPFSSELEARFLRRLEPHVCKLSLTDEQDRQIARHWSWLFPTGSAKDLCS